MRPAPFLLALACALAPLSTPACAQAEPPVAVAAPSPSVLCGHDHAPADEPETYPDDERRASKDPCAVADNNLAREEAEF